MATASGCIGVEKETPNCFGGFFFLVANVRKFEYFHKLWCKTINPYPYSEGNLFWIINSSFLMIIFFMLIISWAKLLNSLEFNLNIIISIERFKKVTFWKKKKKKTFKTFITNHWGNVCIAIIVTILVNYFNQINIKLYGPSYLIYNALVKNKFQLNK